jgi:hypothetical protein
VSNGTETRTALAPWVDAGAAGKVDIIWWGTSSSSNLNTGAQWKVFFAQTQNALAVSPSILQSAATGIFHTGAICVNGTGCASGTRDLAEYASTMVYRDGLAMIVYPDDQNSSPPETYFTRQSGGTGVSGTVARRQPGEFSDPVTAASLQLAINPNYPNPFNPSTTISYSIPERQFVSLKVYSLLGNEVSTLEGQVKEAGTYTARFPGEGLPSGFYFCRLQTGRSVIMRKMLHSK